MTMSLAVSQAGGVFSDTLQAGKDWSSLMPSASYPNTAPFQIEDSVYFISQDNSSLEVVSMNDLKHGNISASGAGDNWNYIPCDITCAVDSIGFFRYQNNAWTRLKQSSVVENICQSRIALDAVENQGVTIFVTNNVLIGAVNGGKVILRSIGLSSTFDNHSIDV